MQYYVFSRSFTIFNLRNKETRCNTKNTCNTAIWNAAILNFGTLNISEIICTCINIHLIISQHFLQWMKLCYKFINDVIYTISNDFFYNIILCIFLLILDIIFICGFVLWQQDIFMLCCSIKKMFLYVVLFDDKKTKRSLRRYMYKKNLEGYSWSHFHNPKLGWTYGDLKL